MKTAKPKPTTNAQVKAILNKIKAFHSHCDEINRKLGRSFAIKNRPTSACDDGK